MLLPSAHYVVLIMMAILALGLARSLCQYRTMPAASAYMGLLSTALVWVAATIFASTAASASVQLFWTDVGLVAVSGSAIALLLCATHYANTYAAIPRPVRILLFSAPVLLAALLLLGPWAHLETRLAALGMTAYSAIITSLFAAAPWLHTVAILLMWGAGFTLLCYALWTQDEPGRRLRAGLVAVVGLIAGTAYLTNVFEPWRVMPIDGASYLFFAAVVALYGALFYSQTPQLQPEAQRVLFETTKHGVIFLDRQNRIVEINSAAQRLVGWTTRGQSNTAVGQSIQHALPEWTMLMVYLQGAAREYETAMQLTIAGEPRSFDVRISPIYANDARFLGRVLELHETTEIERAREALRQRKQQLRTMVQQTQTLSRSRSQVTTELIRELSTPLTNIRFYTSLLERDHLDSQRRYLENLHREVNSLQDLLDSWATPESVLADEKNAPTIARPVELNDVMRTIVSRHGAHAEAVAVDMHVESSPPIYTLGHYEQLVHAMSSLVEQSIAGAAQGGAVSIRLYQEDDYAFVQVQERDAGIERSLNKEEANRSRVGASPLVDWQGVERIVDQHGGRIDIHHEDDHRNQYTIRLPHIDVGQMSQWQSGHRFRPVSST